MAGHKKFCTRCEQQILPKQGYSGVKPHKFPRYKWLCEGCVKEIGGYNKIHDFLLPYFQAGGFKGTKI